jgi:hypothetical protein
MGIQPTADELERDSRAALNDQEKSLSIPIEAIFGVPADKLGFRPHARLAMQPRGAPQLWQKVIIKQHFIVLREQIVQTVFGPIIARSLQQEIVLGSQQK